MIINISDRKDTKFLLCNNTLSVEIKFHWQIIAFFLLYRWHSSINNVSLFTLGAILPEKTTSRIKYHDLINLLHTCEPFVVQKVKNVKCSSFSNL